MQKKIISNKKTFIPEDYFPFGKVTFMGYVKLHGYKPEISMEAKYSMLDTLFKQSVGKKQKPSLAGHNLVKPPTI